MYQKVVYRFSGRFVKILIPPIEQTFFKGIYPKIQRKISISVFEKSSFLKKAKKSRANWSDQYGSFDTYIVIFHVIKSDDQRLKISTILNPIPCGLKYILFHTWDFALAEPMMHQKLWKFIHIKFEQFVSHRKRKQHFKSKKCGRGGEKKIVAWNASKKFGRFKTLLQK